MDIKFSFVLNTKKPTIPSEWYVYNLGYIEGTLDIFLNDKLFFQEPYFNLAEFGIALGKWVQKVQTRSINRPSSRWFSFSHKSTLGFNIAFNKTKEGSDWL